MSSGAMRPALAPASIDMLQTVMRPSIDRPRMAEPRYSMTEPMPPPVPMRPMMARIRSLAVTPSGSSPSTFDGHGAGHVLVQRLGGEDVLDLAGADAEGQGPEGAVGGGVAVAADDGHPRHGEALLGPDDVDDALPGRAHGVLDDAELVGVGAQHLDLLAADRIGDGLVDRLGGDVVVLGGDGELRAAHPPVGQPEAVEGLRGGDLVDEVQIDVEQIGLAVGPVDQVLVPDLLGEGPGLGHGSSLRSSVRGIARDSHR